MYTKDQLEEFDNIKNYGFYKGTLIEIRRQIQRRNCTPEMIIELVNRAFRHEKAHREGAKVEDAPQ